MAESAELVEIPLAQCDALDLAVVKTSKEQLAERDLFPLWIVQNDPEDAIATCYVNISILPRHIQSVHDGK
jgi:hypothetical protein